MLSKYDDSQYVSGGVQSLEYTECLPQEEDVRHAESAARAGVVDMTTVQGNAVKRGIVSLSSWQRSIGAPQKQLYVDPWLRNTHRERFVDPDYVHTRKDNRDCECWLYRQQAMLWLALVTRCSSAKTLKSETLTTVLAKHVIPSGRPCRMFVSNK